jgi:hypothetical protein
MAQGRLKQAELVSEVLKTDSALAETLAAARPVYYTKSGIVGMQLEQAIPENRSSTSKRSRGSYRD